MNEPVSQASMADAPPAVDRLADDAPASPGRQLAAARQLQGWSIEQVAAQLKLAPRQIQALEADRLDELPSITVARGFIGTYARLLKIDAAPLLTGVASDAGSPIEAIGRQGWLSAPFSAARLPSMLPRRATPNWRGMLALGLALVAAAGIWAIQQTGWRPALPEAVLGAGGRLAPQPAAQAPVAAADTAEPSGAAAPAVQAEPAQTVAGEAKPSETPAPTPVAEAAAPAAENNLLSLVLHQDSWIEITRADRSVLVSRLLKAGATETFEIAEPVSLVVGNAAGVEATLRNVPLDLKPGTSSNVARLNLK